MSKRTAVVALVLSLSLPLVATAAGTPRTFSDIANLALAIIGQGTLMLMIAAVAAYFFNISMNMLKLSQGESAEWKSHFFWGIMAIFVMVSIWGIVQILQYTIFTPGGGTAGGSRGTNCASFGSVGCGR
jgi:ABC-type dipeptide/oligopeptide/nickel transport system permease component